MTRAAEDLRGKRLSYNNKGELQAGTAVVVKAEPISRTKMPPLQDLKRQYQLAFALNTSIELGDKARAEALLADGAPVNGSNLLEYRPLAFTAVCGGADLARLFIERGSDLNARVAQDIFTDAGLLSVKKGTSALTMAIRNCHVDVFGLLVEAGADLNAADSTGFTPLMSASMGVEEAAKGVVMAKALLRAGADPTRVNDEGCIALTYAASEGSAEVVEMLLERAPKTASHATLAGATPLYGAVCHGKERTVVLLLAAGAAQPRRYRRSFCPLQAAVVDGNERLVRVLLGRAKAIGGDTAIHSALEVAAVKGLARIVRMLLLAEGEERQAYWANCASSLGGRILHSASSCLALGTLSALLSAGADETRLDGDGRTPSEAARVSVQDGRLGSEEEAAAVQRMLLRGPAFRARSWAWRSGTTGAAAAALPRGGGGNAACGAEEVGDGDTGEASEARYAGRARRKPPLAVRIYRPENKTFFVQHFGR